MSTEPVTNPTTTPAPTVTGESLWRGILNMDDSINTNTKAIAIIDRAIAQARAEGFAAGQAEMRERAAHECNQWGAARYPAQSFTSEVARRIRALPISRGEPQAARKESQ